MDALATADMAVYAGRQKRPSWSDDERLRLVQEIADRIDVIRGKLGPTLTLRAKRSAWNQVQQALNARNRTHTRTLPEIKKQWSNLVQRCKHRVQAHGRADQLPQRSGRQGENGRTMDLSVVERTILDVIGDDFAYCDFLDGAGPDISADVDGSQDNGLGSSEDETLIQSLDSTVPDWFWKTSARASGTAGASPVAAAVAALGAIRSGIDAINNSVKQEPDDSKRAANQLDESDEEGDDVAETLGIVYESVASNKQLVPREATCTQVGPGRKPIETPQRRESPVVQALPPPQAPARHHPRGAPETSGDGEDAGNRCDEGGADDDLTNLRKTLLMEQIKAAREQAKAFQAVTSAAQAVRDSVVRVAKSRAHTEKVKRRKLTLQLKKIAD
ncbi:uncharacterized protein LOC144178842 [Haemaphysalis longicornis]